MNKCVVIVGASRGIGLELTRIFAKLPNFTIYALSRNCEHLKKEFLSVRHVHIHSFDLEGDIETQLSTLDFPASGVDFVINNAGLLVKKPIEMLTLHELERSFRVNVIGVMQTVQFLLNKLNKSFSHIVNISTLGAFQGSVKFPSLAAYASSKAALCNFTELFAEEFKAKPIKMNCLCLGAVQTEMLSEAFPGYEALISANQMAEFIVEFTLKNGHFMNGKIVPVSLSTP